MKKAVAYLIPYMEEQKRAALIAGACFAFLLMISLQGKLRLCFRQ